MGSDWETFRAGDGNLSIRQKGSRGLESPRQKKSDAEVNGIWTCPQCRHDLTQAIGQILEAGFKTRDAEIERYQRIINRSGSYRG